MTRTGFDYALEEMHNDVLRMGSIVEKQIHKCVESLVKQDSKLANETIKDDDLVDNLQKEIDDKCIKLTGKEQPLAIDLRTIFITTKLITDLERMADHAVDIAKVTLRLENEKYVKELTDISDMSELVNNMIKKALDAYVSMNVEEAYKACEIDDEIDGKYKNIFSNILEIMVQDHKKVAQMTQLLFVCKYLERIADHVTNICEETIYLVTGEQKDLNE
ncbi:phosphate transport system protein [Clostridium algifaecis]|uniref:Phosphate-specific transport system accessory protein PhoU n=1 Tax=Clostridium algifaecis TaxID=1472040 RepID=A0ABS4KNH5_9CLOT|nr:phosphate signaling complex protein PhoU [Clostridium algifaecis]MBP2031591.1 phosphate transport system protein [Clostridium algifaecis]